MSITGGGSATSDGNNSCALNAYPVNLYTGEKIFSSRDLTAEGFEGMSQTRQWATDPAYVEGTMGPGWRHGFARLVDKGTKVVLVIGSRHARSWVKSGGNYVADPDYSYKDTLVTSGDGTAINMKDEDGNNLQFFSFTYSVPEVRGKLVTTVNAYFTTAGLSGTATSYGYNKPGGFTGPYELMFRRQFEQTAGVPDTTTETWLDYGYTLIGSTYKVTTVTLSRVIASVKTTVRSVAYEYYTTTTSNGPAGSLRRARVKDAAGTTIEVKYYRYNVDAQSQVTPKLIVEGESYERLKAASGGTDSGVDSASDATVATYSNLQLTFDTNLRVTSEKVQGVGTVTLSSATDSAHADGPNNWKRKVTETLPNGDQNIVYTNARAQAVMKIFKEFSTSLEWKTWYLRDTNGRVIQEATPTAVTGYNESYANLVDGDGGNLQYIADSAGLIKVTEYASSTTAGQSTAGDVAGYVKARYVKEGENGTQVKVEQTQFYAHNSTAVWPYSHTVYPIANGTRYRNTDGTGGQTVGYTYGWFVPPSSGESNKIETTTTTYPIVTTAQNGSNAATSDLRYFDKWGRSTWSKDADGFVHVTRYDRGTGAVTQRIRDVQTTTTTDEPSGWTTPAGGGLHLTWNYEYDLLSRTTREQDPDLRDTYTVYNDANWETKVYPGWTGTTTTGPTQVTRKDKAGSYTEFFATSRAPTVSGGKPTGTETYIGSNLIHSMERTFRDSNGWTTKVETFHSFSSLTYQVTASLGVLGNNYYRQTFGYDTNGRRDRDVDWTGTIRRTVYDGRGRMVSNWIGTDDTPTSGTWSPTNLTGTNTIKTNEYVYDAGSVGNDNLTTSKLMTSASTSLDTAYQYDFRSRRTDTRGPDNVAVKGTYDNLGQVTLQETYSSADFTYTAGELRAKSETKFDEKGQVYQTIVHNVDPGTGAIGNRLTSNVWSNARGARIKAKGPNGEFQKSVYDGAGRPSGSFLSYHDAETAYTDADDVVGDTVISQTVNAYDGAGNVIQTTSYQRTDDAASTGDLSTSWAETDSRRTYTAKWFDLARRLTSSVNYGRNGGSALSRPSTAPAPNLSNMVLVTKYDYATDTGRRYRVTNNKARITEFTFDMLTRVKKTVENYVNGAYTETEFDTDRTTEQTYDTSGRLSQILARNPKGSGLGTETQTTTYAYGTDANQASPAVWRNDVLVGEIYPDTDDTYNAGGAAGSKFGNGANGVYDRVEYTYDYASRKLTWKLQDTTTHTYTFDSAGRLFSDAATTLGSGIDGAVLRLEYAYDSLGRPLTVSSYGATSGGTLLNQIGYAYDGWGQETACTQGHEGTATGAPGYTKAFADGAVSGEAKYVRLSSATYPNGGIVYSNYPTSGTVGDKLSRTDNLANDASGTTKYAQYTYMGTGAIVKIAHPAVAGGFNLDFGTGVGNPTGWDDVGRVIDQKWQDNAGTPVIKDRYQYGYDNTSNRTFRDNLTASAKDQFFVMDGLDRVTTDKRGDLNAGRTDITGTPVFQEAWVLEGLGNWKSLDQTTAGVASLNQTRTHTKANETTTIGIAAGGTGTNWGDGVLDLNGNMTRVPKPSTPNELWRLTYDAWNRLVKVVNDVGGGTIAEYKYDARHRRTVKLKPNGANWDRIDYYYTCEWQVAEERQLLNNASKVTVATIPLQQYVWDVRYIDAPVLRWRNNDFSGDGSLEQTLYYAQDANMNVTALVNTSGTVVEYVQYDAYGKHALFQNNWTTSQASTVYNNEILYTGYRLNPESGMYQVRHREYHPILGRWTTRDPIGYVDGWNQYQLVSSRPALLKDPMGLLGCVEGDCEFKITKRHPILPHNLRFITAAGDAVGISDLESFTDEVLSTFKDKGYEKFMEMVKDEIEDGLKKGAEDFSKIMSFTGNLSTTKLFARAEVQLSRKTDYSIRRCVCNRETLTWEWTDPSDESKKVISDWVGQSPRQGGGYFDLDIKNPQAAAANAGKSVKAAGAAARASWTDSSFDARLKKDLDCKQVKEFSK